MQLLRITSTPMKYQFVSEPARLEYQNDMGGYTMQKQGGRFNMTSQNTRVQMDSTEFRNTLGYKSRAAALQDFAQRSQRAGQEAVAQSVDNGNEMIHIERGASIPDILYSRLMQNKLAGSLQMTPLAPIQMDWVPPELNINYEPVQQTFDWRTAKSALEFVPGKFSVDILQYAEVKIEYLGRPIYVPPSADPEYQD